VRVLLHQIEGRELCFVRELLSGISDVVTTGADEAALIRTETLHSADLIVIARDAWGDRDTDLCRRVYAERPSAPLLLVSGPCDAVHRATALRAGADDFMGIPFEVDELVARAFALVRRASAGSRYARVGPFALDLARRQIVLRERKLMLTVREYDLLSTLIDRAGEVVNRKDLEASAARTVGGAESNAIDVHMSRIRDKLGSDAISIETVRGLGYRLKRPSPSD
jgi:DNA-binding response OmpR family regulator